MPFDRTSSMGLFPHDGQHGEFTDNRTAGELQEVAADAAASKTARDAAIWLLAHKGVREARETLLAISTDARDVGLRRSAAWALFKLESQNGHDLGLIAEMASADDDNTNARTWKDHLLAEARGEPLPTRAPIRRVEGRTFDVSMPLVVEGRVEFRDANGHWRVFSTGSDVRGLMVGDLVAFLKSDTFMDALVMQKTIQNIGGTGRDFIEGYKFRGLSRKIGEASIVHYYESLWRHKLYLSGRSGDESGGVIPGIKTHLIRTAETDIYGDSEGIFPVSVRGVFYGSVFANVDALVNPEEDPSGAIQIVSRSDPRGAPFVNGLFFGTFRGVPIDVDGDGVIEINGIDEHVDVDGEVLEKRPETRNYPDIFELFRSARA